MPDEERLKQLEIDQAVLKSQLKEHFRISDIFHEKVIQDLEYLKERDVKVFQYIETRMEKEQASKELRQAVLAKIATSGIWAAIVFVIYILWNALIEYIQKGPH